MTSDAQRHHASRYQVVPCPAHRRREALLHLAAVHTPSLQAGLQQALTASTESDWQGLWVAMEGEYIRATAWVQPLANQTAQLWLPRHNDAAAQALLSALPGWVKQQPIILCHVVLTEPWAAWEDTLIKSGMRAMATLEHRAWPCRAALAPQQPLRLRPFKALTLAEQQALLARVGEDSLDCPALRHALPVSTLLAGFQSQATSAYPQHWYSLEYQEEPVGVLLLATPSLQWSLQLMGLVPEWRGQGLGHVIIEHAQSLAAQAGAQCLTLTVDEQNTPAQRVYAQAGFIQLGRERLLGWY